MSESRIRLRLDPQMEEVDTPHTFEVHEEMDVAVETHLSGVSLAGLVAAALGLIAIVVSFVDFLIGYPATWYAWDGDLAAKQALVRLVILAGGSGVTAVLMGVSLFFFGRTVVGSGNITDYHLMQEAES